MKKFTAQSIHLPIAPVWLGMRLLGVALLLTLISLLGVYARLYTDYMNLHRYVHHLIDKTNMDAELSIPMFYTVLLLLAASFLSWFVSRDKASVHPLNRQWAVLGAIFLLLAMDEATGFHELMNASTLQGYAPESNFLHWTWVIPGALFALTVLAFYIPFLRTLPQRTAGFILLAGALYVGGAIGVEMVGANFFTVDGEQSLSYKLTTHLEEFLEMAGLIMFIYAASDYIKTNWKIVIQQKHTAHLSVEGEG
ncbi:hypothetical protein [Fibrella aquatica]|uniref:hypothetical protein n=1 Tax=Fibrella aquatica TaxID=3242487 RepID=UPI00352045D8